MKSTSDQVVLIRANGSRRVGLGHISRTLVLAEGFRCAGYDLVFLTRDGEPGVTARVRAAGFRVELIPEDAEWPEDAERTGDLVRHARARMVVTDLEAQGDVRQREAYRAYLVTLKGLGILLVTFDDFTLVSFPSDVVINPNVGAQSLPYQRGEGTLYLLGPRYFPCPRQLAEIGARRTVRGRANRVLVTMGGGAPLGLTAKVIRALGAVRAAEALEVVVLPGLAADRRDAFGSLLEGFPGRIEVIERLADPGPYLEWADVAVTAGGVTKYETAVAGLPGIMLAQVPHQQGLAERFSREGSAQYLGLGSEVSEAEIARAVEALLTDFPRRLTMSRAGRRVVDGRGVSRIVARLQALRGALR